MITWKIKGTNTSCFYGFSNVVGECVCARHQSIFSFMKFCMSFFCGIGVVVCGTNPIEFNKETKIEKMLNDGSTSLQL